MTPTPFTRLLVYLLFALGAWTTIEGAGTGKNGQGGPCVDETPKQDISALFQSQVAQMLTSRVHPPGKPNIVDDHIEASMRPRMQKLMEINATVNAIKTLVAAGATPEVQEIIQSLIDVISTDLQAKVKRDQAFAQSAVDSRIAELTATTEGAVEAKTYADGFDRVFDNCIAAEQTLLEGYETCKTKEATLEAEKHSVKYCSHPDFDIKYMDPPQLPQTLTVDFEQGLAHVQQELDRYLEPLHKWINAMKAKAVFDQVKFDAADKSCKDKTKEREDKTTECDEKLEAWKAHSANCVHAKTAQMGSFCEFGHDYQEKCVAKAAFDSLLIDINGQGTSWSEPDREFEWTQTTRLKCVLAHFKATTELTTGAIDTCTKSEDEAAEQFAQDVTRIDLKQTTYEFLTSQARFTCAEKKIMLGSGSWWTMPDGWNSGVAGWIPKSADYTKATGYEYTIESDSSKAPFTFCLQSSFPTCGPAFECAPRARKAADTNCYVAGGCTSVDCCVHTWEETPKQGLTCSKFVEVGTHAIANEHFWNTQCKHISSSASMVKLRMGAVSDFFKPIPGSDMCEMLRSSNKHQWSNDGLTWVSPAFSEPAPRLHGGSAAHWPKNNIPGDSRIYLSLWGHDSRALGGCCHNSLSDKPGWNKAFQMDYCSLA